jgi:SPP1 gp7 family putative phage head morphogenesis protein
MSSLTEAEVKALMRTDEYQNKYNPKFEETQCLVKQGWKNLYPEDGRNKNPDNYYVWRAVGDGKTRSSHADREGEVFCWDNPPEGGHPGEDYNCRCKAEKYVPPQKEICEYNVPTYAKNHNYLSEPERRKAIKDGAHIRLEVEDNPNARREIVAYEKIELGLDAVKKYESTIDTLSRRHGVDSDLVKAVMYIENATGHKYGFNDVADKLGVSGSQMPMNINGGLWSNFGGKYLNVNNSTENIELSVMLLKNLGYAIEDSTPEKIGTLWNGLSMDKVNDVGARIGRAYEDKPWKYNHPDYVNRLKEKEFSDYMRNNTYKGLFRIMKGDFGDSKNIDEILEKTRK